MFVQKVKKDHVAWQVRRSIIILKNHYIKQNVFGQNVSMIIFLFKFQTNLDAQNGLHGEIARQDGEREHEEAYVRDLQEMLRNVQV